MSFEPININLCVDCIIMYFRLVGWAFQGNTTTHKVRYVNYNTFIKTPL